MSPASIPVVELLPHGPEMTLIDRLVESTAERSVAVVEITATTRFVEEGGVPAWVGIEYMAQTIAARIGFEARMAGDPPPIGFLLGTRKLDSEVTAFPVDSRLRVVVRPAFVESGFGSFSCSIELGRVVVTAVLNTYQPSEHELAELT